MGRRYNKQENGLNSMQLHVCRSKYMQGGRGYWAVYYTYHQSFMICFPTNFWDLYWFLIGLFFKFQPLIVNYRRFNFVDHHCGCTSIYCPLSYPFRTLKYMCKHLKYITQVYQNYIWNVFQLLHRYFSNSGKVFKFSFDESHIYYLSLY